MQQTVAVVEPRPGPPLALEVAVALENSVRLSEVICKGFDHQCTFGSRADHSIRYFAHAIRLVVEGEIRGYLPRGRRQPKEASDEVRGTRCLRDSILGHFLANSRAARGTTQETRLHIQNSPKEVRRTRRVRASRPHGLRSSPCR